MKDMQWQTTDRAVTAQASVCPPPAAGGKEGDAMETKAVLWFESNTEGSLKLTGT